MNSLHTIYGVKFPVLFPDSSELPLILGENQFGATFNTATSDHPEATSATLSVSSSSVSASESHESANSKLMARSYNPWQYPEKIRERLLTPIYTADLQPPLKCNIPLVDTVAISCEQGTLIALSNFTLQPINRVELKLRTAASVIQVESVRHGILPFEQTHDNEILITLPLDASDFVLVSVDKSEGVSNVDEKDSL